MSLSGIEKTFQQREIAEWTFETTYQIGNYGTQKGVKNKFVDDEIEEE